MTEPNAGAMPAGAGAMPASTTPSPAENDAPLNFDGWLNGQDEPVKQLVNERFEALQNTVKATRTEREDLAKQLRDATKKLAEGSEARQALEGLSEQLEQERLRATFYEDAARPELGCSNPRLAYLGAQEISAIDGKGRVSWDAIKTAFPELFRTPHVTAHAGDGTGRQPPTGKSMNDFIRKSAGR